MLKYEHQLYFHAPGTGPICPVYCRARMGENFRRLRSKYPIPRVLAPDTSGLSTKYPDAVWAHSVPGRTRTKKKQKKNSDGAEVSVRTLSKIQLMASNWCYYKQNMDGKFSWKKKWFFQRNLIYSKMYYHRKRFNFIV